MTRWLLTVMAALAPMGTQAQVLHDPIPEEFRGSYAPTLTDCRDPQGVEVIEVVADGVHYYEGDDYLLIGVKFHGSSTRSGKAVPLFNGRFTGRMETQLLGEVSARMEMETPDTLIRYVLNEDGEPDSEPVSTWVRCPRKPAIK